MQATVELVHFSAVGRSKWLLLILRYYYYYYYFSPTSTKPQALKLAKGVNDRNDGLIMRESA